MNLKKLLLCICIPFVIWGIERFCHHKTAGFTVWRVSSDLPFNSQWEVIPSPEETEATKHILDQSFSYLGRGAQSYAFLSEDGQYVLKFFQYYRMRPPIWAPLVPSSFSKEKVARRTSLLHQDFDSYKIAFENLKVETGLVYLHLNKTNHFLNKKTKIIDRLGIVHTIDMDQMEFLLQKKADLAYPTIKKLMSEDEEKAKQAIDNLLELIITRCHKGIFDKDADLSTNFGFCQEKAVQIDAGRFRWDSTRTQYEVTKADLLHSAGPFKKWLIENQFNTLADHLDEKINAY